MKFRGGKDQRIAEAQQRVATIARDLLQSPLDDMKREAYAAALNDYAVATAEPDTFYCPCCKRDEVCGEQFGLVVQQAVIRRDGHWEIIDFNEPMEIHLCADGWNHLGLTEHIETMMREGVPLARNVEHDHSPNK